VASFRHTEVRFIPTPAATGGWQSQKPASIVHQPKVSTRGQCKLQTVDRALTEFLQAEGIHNHPIRRHRGGALELRFAKAPHFFLAENRAGRVDSYDATVLLLSGFNVPLPVTGTVAFADRPQDSDKA
jgi:hypothetical protein